MEKKFSLYGIFHNRNMDRPDVLEEDTTPTLKRFFKLFGRRFWNLISLNLMILLMVLYVIYLTISNMFNGKKILVNRRSYKQTVRYVFYPAGFIMVYENGISHVMYEDLDVMFEDEEGLALFFSPRQCLFLPTRYMRSPEGIRLSHFFKASLFNLDPRRGRRKYKIEDKPLIDFTKVKELFNKKPDEKVKPQENSEQSDNGFGF